MKKIIGLILASVMLMLSLAACQETGNGASTTNPPSNQTANPPVISTDKPESQTEPTVNSASITVISREDGSGTRGAFTELFGVLNADKVDQTTDMAEITNSTSVMMTSVAGNPDAIGDRKSVV